MKTPNDRLREARFAAGYKDPASAARAMGISTVTYYSHENGTRGLVRSARRYAEFFRVSLDWLLTGRGAPPGQHGLFIAGHVGAGAEVYPEIDGAAGYAIDQIDAPVRLSRAAVGVWVRGDSMYPAFESGDILVYEEQRTDFSDLIGKRTIVKLQDGRMFVKRLRRGSTKDFYYLESTNAPPIEDVKIEWAAPIVAAIMKR
jgi:transcriptional regulator with XRE-family HTH domain